MPGNYSKLVTVITGQTITAAERNNEFDNVINNMTPDGVDDASANLAAMQATVDPSGGSLATSLRGELQRQRFQLLKLGSAAGNWYDALPFLAGVTPAAAAATATDLNNRLAHFASQIKNLGGLTNWYDAVTAALLKAGGTISGDLTVSGALNLGTQLNLTLTTQIASNMSVAGKTYLNNNSGSTIVVQGFADGTTGQVIVFTNKGAGAVLLVHNGSGTKKFLMPSSLDLYISPGAGAILIYDNLAGGWVCFGSVAAGGQYPATSTNDDAATGNAGEYVESVFSNIASAATTVWSDAANISLSAGDWDISLNILGGYSVFGANTGWSAGISTTTGNSTTGLVLGSNYAASLVPIVNSYSDQRTITAWRKKFSTTTTVYAKHMYAFSAGSWASYGRLSARRPR